MEFALGVLWIEIAWRSQEDRFEIALGGRSEIESKSGQISWANNSLNGVFKVI